MIQAESPLCRNVTSRDPLQVEELRLRSGAHVVKPLGDPSGARGPPAGPFPSFVYPWRMPIERVGPGGKAAGRPRAGLDNLPISW
jgi:hypothetical protein